ncbi:MAG: GH3 auxin-responsive promoter family protein [Flavobacteriales bacterium]|nr:GH3 auxin-responsive promoter family protein [Flavobacteriales bacterium]
MAIVNSVISWVLKKRQHQIDLFKKYPIEVQQEWFTKLINTGKNTEFGKKHGFENIQTRDQYAALVPLQDYESLKDQIIRVKHGEQNVLWPTEIKWFAKSSGTTSAKSKFIPVSKESLEDCHYKGGKDLLSIYFNQFPESELFVGKGLVIGGSSEVNQFGKNSYYGDLSSIIIKNLPYWAEYVRTPSMELALHPEWEEKIQKIAEAGAVENVTNISGVPSWNLTLLHRILEITGKKNMLEVWPNFELYAHGGVNFAPYRKQFEELFPSDNVVYLQTYNASEGFFGIQDIFEKDTEDVLLMLDYGIYYEFVPMNQIHESHPSVVLLEDVEIDVDYAMVISTNAGLWRYMIGDTVRFTSLSPFRIRVSGRTKYYINAFGEELVAENAEHAIKVATEKTDSIISEYTAAPFFDEKQGGHEWLIEFEKPPNDLEYFTEILDNALKSVNSDYEAKRYHDLNMLMPRVKMLEKGSFFLWLKKKGKLGGQNKVPRLANNRDTIDSVLSVVTPK